jgi:hypothetical protein
VKREVDHLIYSPGYRHLSSSTRPGSDKPDLPVRPSLTQTQPEDRQVTVTADTATLTAADVLKTLRRHHKTAAHVPELVIHDDYPNWAELPDNHREPYTRRIDALMFDTL